MLDLLHQNRPFQALDIFNKQIQELGLDRTLVIFQKLASPDTVSWNTLLSGFKDNKDALSFACRMNHIGVAFDAVTYTTALAHCEDCEEFMFGTHQEGSYEVEAVSNFIEMIILGMKLDHVSFTNAVSACGHARNLGLGKQIHGLAVKRGHETHESVCNVLISTYSKCDQVKDAKLVFEGMVNRNVVSWTTMISISEEHAVSLFTDMRRDDVYPNEVTFVGLIHALCANNMVKEGETVHGLCIKSRFFQELVVANSFIIMYVKFESIQQEIKVFQETEDKVIISWNSLISWFTQNKM
ncbi:hypothetical protein L1987_14255 [Smallanthus sonchifolius]|uniref:Uncharacterized protein n=1 Tax=Smallanthus sonchifolius TaxID=185202 RepID=A0ACB9J4B6_9ASTR|nr:hypothetical protein L1987_14255 [Smallanthus sonchifolius]